jgi:ATP-binding cassette, subfamily B, bacterial
MTVIELVADDDQTACGSSGLTGTADLTEPPAPVVARGLWALLRRWANNAHGTVAGLWRVLALVREAAPALTVCLAVTTALAGLIPAATAATTRLLVNAVVTASGIHARHLPDRVPAPLPVPGLPHAVVSSATAVVVLVAVQFAVFTLGLLMAAGTRLCGELLQDKTALTVQLKIMDHAGRLDLAHFEDSKTYDLLQQAGAEAAVRPVTMVNATFGLVQTAITFVTLIGLLAALSPLLALLALAAPLPAFMADARYGRLGFALSMWTSPARRRMQYLSRLVATDTFAKEVQLFGLAPFLTQRFRLLAAASYRRQRRLAARRGLAVPSLSVLSTLAGCLIYGYVAFAVVSGRLTIGDLALYTAATAALQAAIQTLFQTASGMYENNLYLDVLYRFLAIRPTIAAPRRPRPVPVPLRGRVEFEHVTFRYQGASRPALRDVSFVIEPGQTVAVVGANGAGKSTLVKLLCRLYDPQEGRILLDGVDLREFDPAELRRHIGALFQDFVSYQATAAENIGLGDVRRIEARGPIERAARRAGAAGFVEDLPYGYDTALGRWFDQGSDLSGGQWQKLALGRAFMRDAPLLVLDEPSAALDARAEHELFERLRDLGTGRSALYISHRFSTVRQADRIVLLENGAVGEEGTHDDLIALGGTYAELFGLQASAYTG